MLISTEVEIRVRPATLDYYKSLGYEIPIKKSSKSYFISTGKEFVYDFNKPIIVKVSDLPRYNETKVLVECDICKKNRMFVAYYNYITVMEKTGNYACRDCSTVKYKQTLKKRYNVDNVLQIEGVRDKMTQAYLKKYNTTHPMYNDDFKAALKKSLLNKYGVDCSLKIPEVKEKVTKLWIEKYGVDHVGKSPEVHAKIAQSLYKNGSVPISKQQLYLFNLFNINDVAKINYPVSHFNVDICFPQEKIIIEYNGGGHDLMIKFGTLSQEEFDKKEMKRFYIIKREGYKQIEIVSRKDLLPFDEVLFKMLNDAEKYFKNTQHSWVKYDIDNSLLFNFEHKDGILYDFGSLRTIKDSDLIDSQFDKNKS